MKFIFKRTSARFLFRRFIQSVILILLLIVVNFFLIHLAPGDPVTYLAGQSGNEQYYEFIREKFGLNEPLLTQLWVYFKQILNGDLGYSLSYQQSVSNVIFSRVPATLLLTLSSMIIATISGIILGVEAARRENSLFDRTANIFALIGNSFPSFSIAQILLLIFALYLGLFPAQGMTSVEKDLSGFALFLDLVWHLALPVVTLVIIQIAQIMRLMRTEMLNVLGENFITTARAKGVSDTRVLYSHALRNALLPIITIFGTNLGMILSGAVLVETVFGYPGLGRLMIEVIAARDYPVLMGLFLLTSISVIVMNFVTDLTYTFLDPRIKYIK